MSMDTTLSQTRTGGLTSTTIRDNLQSDPAQARELGAYFSANRTQMIETRSLGTFDVDGATEGVLYGRTETGDVARNMQRGPVMTAGSRYDISAEGSVDKNGWWLGGDVSPTDRTDDGRTRLQVAITKDGQTLETFDYTPDANGRMSITPQVDGAELGFFFLDGDMSDNSGQFRVRVDETQVRQVETNVAIEAENAAGVYEAGSQIVQALDTAPAAASLPAPDLELSCPAPEEGLVADRSTDTVHTHDGYSFQFENNRIAINWPGREGPATVIDGRDVSEADGTTWRAEDGNYIIPNGAMLQLQYDGDNIRSATIVHGDSKVDVHGPGWGDGAVELGDVTDGGFAFRQEAVENNVGGRTYRMGGFNDRLDDWDVTWNAEMYGQDLGRVETGHDPSRDQFRTDGERYYVDPQLRPQFGTEDYERLLSSEIQDQAGLISGAAQEQGFAPDLARKYADYLLGNSGGYDAYSREIMASEMSRQDPQMLRQLQEQALMQQIMGGLPREFQNYPEAMQAVQYLAKLLASQSSMQGDYNQNMSNLRSQFPGGDPNQGYGGDPNQGYGSDLAVQQALAGLANRRGADPMQRFDINRDMRARGRFANDPGAGLLAQRMNENYGQTTGGGIANDISNYAKGVHAGRGATAARAARGAVTPRTSMFRGRGAPLRAGQNIIDMVQNPRTGVWEVPKNPRTTALALRNADAATGGSRALARTTDAVTSTATAARGGSRALSALRAVGKPLVVVGIVADTIDISSSYNRDVERGDGNFSETKRAVGRSAGGWAGAAGGAAAGAAIGSVVPVLGTAVGAVVGGVIGAFGGSAVGDWLGGLF